MITLTQPPHNVCQPLSLTPGATLEFIPDGKLRIGRGKVSDKYVKSERPIKHGVEAFSTAGSGQATDLSPPACIPALGKRKEPHSQEEQ